MTDLASCRGRKNVVKYDSITVFFGLFGVEFGDERLAPADCGRSMLFAFVISTNDFGDTIAIVDDDDDDG